MAVTYDWNSTINDSGDAMEDVKGWWGVVQLPTTVVGYENSVSAMADGQLSIFRCDDALQPDWQFCDSL